jgi:hypothetical protein
MRCTSEGLLVFSAEPVLQCFSFRVEKGIARSPEVRLVGGEEAEDTCETVLMLPNLLGQQANGAHRRM